MGTWERPHFGRCLEGLDGIYDAGGLEKWALNQPYDIMKGSNDQKVYRDVSRLLRG